MLHPALSGLSNLKAEDTPHITLLEFIGPSAISGQQSAVSKDKLFSLRLLAELCLRAEGPGFLSSGTERSGDPGSIAPTYSALKVRVF